MMVLFALNLFFNHEYDYLFGGRKAPYPLIEKSFACNGLVRIMADTSE